MEKEKYYSYKSVIFFWQTKEYLYVKEMGWRFKLTETLTR